MNVWILNHYAIPPTQNGGTRHFSLAKYLAKKGHKVTIFANNFSHFSLKKIAEPSYISGVPEIFDLVAFVWIPSISYKGNSLKRLLNMLIYMMRVLRGKYRLNMDIPDIIIGSSPHPFAVFAAVKLAKRYKVPFVYEIRDIWPETLLSLNKVSKYHPITYLFSRIEQYAFKKATHVITIVPLVASYMKNKGYHNTPVTVIPNFIDLALLPLDVKPIQKSKLTVMYAGNHGLTNNLDTVIKAARELESEGLNENIEIVLIGSGPEKPYLKELTNEYKISMVKFLDPVPKDKIYTILKNADVFLLPLMDSVVFKWGVNPNKLFDYLAIGRPIIYSVSSSNNIVSQHGLGISIPASNYMELTRAIKKMANMQYEQCLEIGVKARKLVEECYNAEKLALQLQKILQQSINVFCEKVVLGKI